MPSATSAIAISRPIEDVFAVLTDVEKTGLWFPGNIEEHWTSPPPHGVGATRHAVITMFGRRTETDAVATEYRPPHRAAMQGTSKNAPFLVTLAFTREDTGTRVEVTSAFMFRGAMRLLGPVVSALYGRQWARGLATLKRLMESGAL